MQNVSITLETFGAAIREIQIRTQFIMKVNATINSSVSISHILKMKKSELRSEKARSGCNPLCGLWMSKREKATTIGGHKEDVLWEGS